MLDISNFAGDGVTQLHLLTWKRKSDMDVYHIYYRGDNTDELRGLKKTFPVYKSIKEHSLFILEALEKVMLKYKNSDLSR